MKEALLVPGRKKLIFGNETEKDIIMGRQTKGAVEHNKRKGEAAKATPMHGRWSPERTFMLDSCARPLLESKLAYVVLVSQSSLVEDL
jgi:hypothetical protein